MMEKYLSEYSISKTENGQIRDKSIAKGFCAFFGSYRSREITPPLIVEYKAKRRKDGVKPSTIERDALSYEASLQPGCQGMGVG